MNNSIYYIWLSEAVGGSYALYKELVDKLGGVYEVYRAEAQEFAHFSKKIQNRIEALLDKNLKNASRICDYCKRSNITLLCCDEAGYPRLLRQIEDPPLVLYVRGSMPDFEGKMHAAVVGTRKMTEYGKCVAYNIGYSLAKNGAVVVSGMALGNDSVAMCAALDAGGDTIGVLGCGVDIAYPKEHSGFMKNILSAGGTVISEYPPGTSPEPEYFVRRNRIISGLCRATVVIEGDMRSGALHTARFAVSQGRSLYAIPGKLGEKSSEGAVHLISDGAKIAFSALDILKEYAFLYRGMLDLKTYPELDSAGIDAKLHALGVRSRTGVGANAVGRKPEEKSAEKKVQNAKITDKKERIGIIDTIASALKKEKGTQPDNRTEELLGSLPADVRDVYEALPKEQMIFADDAQAYGISAQKFLMSMTLLEIKGLAEAFPGARFVLKDRL